MAALSPVARLGYLTATADRLFFLLGPGGETPRPTELWTSDGTASGTRPVEGARPVVNDGLRYVVTASRDRVFFSAARGTELQASDGTEAGPDVAFGPAAGGFFYGTALGQAGQAFALVPEAEPAGLYAVGADGSDLVAALRVGTSNETLVPFAGGVLFGAYAAASGQPPGAAAFYAATADGVARVSPDLPGIDLRGHDVVSVLGDGSVALAAERGGQAEIWRVAPDRPAAPAFALPAGEQPYSRSGIFEVARESRPAPAVVLAGGALHALTVRADGERSAFSLWRDAGDGTARLVARYAPDDPNAAAQFAQAGGAVYVTFGTPEAGFELLALGVAATDAQAPATAGTLSLTVEGAHPARDRVTLRLAAPTGERVRVEAFSVLGRRVAILLDGPARGGPVVFDTSGLAAGVYVVRATAGEARASARVVVAR